MLPIYVDVLPVDVGTTIILRLRNRKNSTYHQASQLPPQASELVPGRNVYSEVRKSHYIPLLPWVIEKGNYLGAFRC